VHRLELDLATQFEIITKRGAFYSYGDIRLGQGRENSKNFLRENPDLASDIEVAVRNHAAGGELVLDGTTPSDDSDKIASENK